MASYERLEDEDADNAADALEEEELDGVVVVDWDASAVVVADDDMEEDS